MEVEKDKFGVTVSDLNNNLRILACAIKGIVVWPSIVKGRNVEIVVKPTPSSLEEKIENPFR